MKTVELFSGTGSFSKVARELGHQTFQTDKYAIDHQDLVADIKTLSATDFPYQPDILWASPPCEGFSVMNIGKNWTHDHKPKTQTAILGEELVRHTLRLISELTPTWWFIENPRDKLRRLDIMEEWKTMNSNPSPNARVVGDLFNQVALTTPTADHTVTSVANGQTVYRHTISYCQYGERRQKPTDIWTNAYWWKPNPLCKRGADCHDAAPRGSRTGTQGMESYKEKSRIPAQLFQQIFSQVPEEHKKAA